MDGETSLDPMLGALLRRPLQALTIHVTADLAGAGFTDLRPAHLDLTRHRPTLPAPGTRAHREPSPSPTGTLRS